MTTGAVDRLRALRVPALVVVALTGIACVVGAFVDTTDFAYAWLYAWLLWMGIAIGMLALGMIHVLAGGYWGQWMRPVLEAGAAAIPALAVLFVPIALLLATIYPWVLPEHTAYSPSIEHKRWWLNPWEFYVRSGLYLVTWTALALTFRKWSREARLGDEAVAKRLAVLSSVGLIYLVLTITLAWTDWAMSLEPYWLSLSYGFVRGSGQMLGGMCAAVAVMVWVRRGSPIDDRIPAARWNDFGTMMMGFLLLWSYGFFMEVLIMWYGNEAPDAEYLHRRTAGGWDIVSGALALVHFFVPFVVLLFRSFKKRPPLLGAMALWLLFMRLVDEYWTVMPAHDPAAISVSWLDVLAPLCIGAALLAAITFTIRDDAFRVPVEERLGEEALAGG